MTDVERRAEIASDTSVDYRRDRIEGVYVCLCIIALESVAEGLYWEEVLDGRV